MNQKEYERFMSYVVFDHATGCAEYIGKKCHRGYGRYWYRGQWRQAHRVRWAWIDGNYQLRQVEREFDPIKWFLNHLCENRECVNLAHLDPCTHKENHQYRAMKYWERKNAMREAELI